MTSGQIPEKPENDDDRKRNPDQPHDQTTAHDKASRAGEARETRPASLGSMAAPALDEKGLEAACAAVAGGYDTDALQIAIAAYLSAMPQQRLPCDVQLPGVKLERGVSYEALFLAIKRRENLPEAETRLASRPAGRVEVKKLEWLSEPWGSQAFTEIGSYRVEDMGHNWSFDRYWVGLSGRVLGKFATESEARVAAQADYEQRIRSALVPAQPAGGEVEQYIQRALDLLQEKTHGSPARSPGHNAQHELKAALAALVPPAAPDGDAVREARSLIQWAHDTLYEINPSNYDHNEVMRLNDASVEVILGLAPFLGEKHGKSDAWWDERKAAHLPSAALSPGLEPTAASGETDAVLSKGAPFGHDPATGFFHADDGGAPASTVFYAPKEAVPANVPTCPACKGKGTLDGVGSCERCGGKGRLTTLPTMEEVAEVLELFAAIADEYSDQEDDDFQVWKDFDALGATLPLRNFRRARALLSRIKGGA